MPALVGRAFGEQVGPGEAEPPALGRPRDASVWGGERDRSGTAGEAGEAARCLSLEKGV